MHRKFWAAFLAVCIMVSMMLPTAFADGAGDAWVVSKEGKGTVTAYWGSLNDTFGLFIEGEGQMKDFNNSTEVPWNNYSNLLGEVQIGEGITNIGSYAFAGCKFNKVVLPSSIKSISANAFTGCTVPVIDMTRPSEPIIIQDDAFSSQSIGIIYSRTEITAKNTKAAVAVTNGGTFSESTEYTSEKLLTPEKEDCEFVGWYTDKNLTSSVEFTSNPTGGTTYYAKWKSTTAEEPPLPEEDQNNDGRTDPDDETDEGKTGGQDSGTGTGSEGTDHQEPDPETPKKLDYDLSNIKFEDGTAVYDGKQHSLEITGTLPDGVTVSYKSDLTPIYPGKYIITAEFTGDTEHYNSIPSKQATLTIEKAEMMLSFGYTSLNVLPTDKPFVNPLIGVPKDAKVTYKSSDVNVADVDENGEVTIISEGETIITASASETSLYKAGSISYKLTVSSKPVEDDGQEDETLSTEVYPNGTKVIIPKDPGKTMTATVVVPDKLDHTVVTIPMADVAYGTVALNASNGEIIKLCVPDSNGLTVMLEQSMNLILFDNSKSFKDVASKYWGKDFINFATAHELFAGTSETQFSPNTSMTRGMMMTVLASFADVDTSGGSVWYERGMNWAKAMGISDGSYPEKDITREQLVVMLYHYVNDPDVSSESSEQLAQQFTDTKKISSYAVTAMGWAVENGIISGMPNKTLNPGGKASRAEVATMMKRICEFIVNENI